MPPSLHRYLYAYSNPTVYVDLYGYESILPHMVGENLSKANQKTFNRGPIVDLLEKHPERFADELTSDEKRVLHDMEVINKRTKKFTVEDLSARQKFKASRMFSKSDDPLTAYVNFRNRDLISRYAFWNSAAFKSFHEGVYGAAKVVDPVLGVGDAGYRALAGKDFFDKPASRKEALAELALIFSTYKVLKVGMEARSLSRSSINNGIDGTIDAMPVAYLNKALERQGLKSSPRRFKEAWIEGDFKYEVRIHEANSQYGKSGSIYRVSRQRINIPKGKQGAGIEYMDSNGKWHSQKTLKGSYKDGTINPTYSEKAAKETHIEVPEK